MTNTNIKQAGWARNPDRFTKQTEELRSPPGEWRSKWNNTEVENETVRLGNELFRNKDENRQRLNGKWLATWHFIYFILFYFFPFRFPELVPSSPRPRPQIPSDLPRSADRLKENRRRESATIPQRMKGRAVKGSKT